MIEETSSAEIERGKRGDEKITAYHCRLFFQLESQRVQHQAELIKALCQSVRNKPFSFASWGRVITAKYMNHPLSAAGSISSFGGRFNYGIHINPTQFRPFSALYLAESHKVALCEKYGSSADISSELKERELALAPTSHHYVRVRGQLNSVLDIRKASSLAKFVQIITAFEIDERTNGLATLAGVAPMNTIKLPNELKSSLHDRNWRAAPTQVNLPANSQVFGKLVHDAGIEGILYNSVRGDGNCLALFPDNFEHSESTLTIVDEMADSVGITQLNKDTWRQLL